MMGPPGVAGLRGGDDTDPKESVLSELPATALLRHEVPGESDHFDWLAELPLPPRPTTDPEATVATFRLVRRLDRVPPGSSIAGERIDDHRRFYLTLEAPRELSGGRGRVEPQCRGRVAACCEVREGWDIELEWDDSSKPLRRQRLRIEGEKGDRVRITALEPRFPRLSEAPT